jgi:hypothetical protein
VEPVVGGTSAASPQTASDTPKGGAIDIIPKSGTATLGKAAKIYDLETLEAVGVVAAGPLDPKTLAIKGSAQVDGVYYLMTQNMVDAAEQHGIYHGIKVSDFLPKQDATTIQVESGMLNTIKKFLSGLWPFRDKEK